MLRVIENGSYIIIGNQYISTEYPMPGIMKNICREIATNNNVPIWIFRRKKYLVTFDGSPKRKKRIVQYQLEEGEMGNYQIVERER